ncbi:MAG: DNA repair protein RecO [Rhizobiales bacterium]|nr:DNA repair protein RecO [Hyphomicrobiales bacterium]
MEWRDEGIVLTARPHGETSAVVDLLTRRHGRSSGLVRGGRSRRLRPVLQIGNHVDVVWKARLADHLGNCTLELRGAYAARAIENRVILSGLQSLASLARLLPERDPHPELFEVTLFVLSLVDEVEIWPALYVRWELALLGELGVGLDLASCAATGATDDLAFVSPRSRRAVSRTAGAPYADRLLALPAFLLPGAGRSASADDIRDGLALTGFFLTRDVLEPRQMALPEARRQVLAAS